MNISNLQVAWYPGQSYANPDPAASEPEKKKTRSEARADAIKQFQKAAQSATIPAIEQQVQQLIGLLIQFKAVGGSMAGSVLVNQLREAADFMEDLPPPEEEIKEEIKSS